MKMKRKILLVLAVLIFVLPCVACADEVNDLLDFYVKKFTPEKAVLIISDKPDSTGLFNEVYMDLKGVVIDKLRLDSLTVQMRGVQFNEPSQWAEGNVECKDAISVLASAKLLESDINRSIENKNFGKKDEHWHDMSMKITPQGLGGRGYYKYAFLDILIEIDSKLKIVKNKELWLDNPQVRVNKLDVPDYVTKKALGKIQPLVNLRKFPLPLTLHKVELKNGEATLSSKKLPQALKDGLTYKYAK